MEAYCSCAGEVVPGLPDADARAHRHPRAGVPERRLRSTTTPARRRSRSRTLLPNSQLVEPPWPDTEWIDRAAGRLAGLRTLAPPRTATRGVGDADAQLTSSHTVGGLLDSGPRLFYDRSRAFVHGSTRRAGRHRGGDRGGALAGCRRARGSRGSVSDVLVRGRRRVGLLPGRGPEQRGGGGRPPRGARPARRRHHRGRAGAGRRLSSARCRRIRSGQPYTASAVRAVLFTDICGSTELTAATR